ncbi:hypothetical protein MRX96_059600 [Rhipicephalus microplus]
MSAPLRRYRKPKRRENVWFDREVNEEEVEDRASFEDAIHNVVFLRRPDPIAATERHKRSYLQGGSEAGLGNGLEGESASTAEITTSPSPLSLPSSALPPTPLSSPAAAVGLQNGGSSVKEMLDVFDVCGSSSGNASSSEHHFCAWVSNQTQMLQEGLHHFTDYSIRVLACHKKLLNRLKQPLYNCETDSKFENEPMCCSVESLTQIRTLPLPDADDIDSSSVVVQHENTTTSDGSVGGLFVKWAPPPDPNCFIVSYQVEYKMVNQEKFKPFQFCVSHSEFFRHGGRVIHGLAPVYFVIAERTVISQGAIIAICLVVVAIVAAAAAAMCFIYQKKKRHQERRSSVPTDKNGAGATAGDFDEEEEEENLTAETPLCNVPSTASEQRPRGFMPDVSSLNDMDEDHLQRCFCDEIEDDDDPDMDAADLALGLAAGDPPVSVFMVPSHCGHNSPLREEQQQQQRSGDELPPSDGSKGSKVSNLSNGSIVNGRMCFPQLGNRTTAC